MKTKGTNFRARIAIYLLFCGLIVFWSFQVFGQEWTESQKEVWKTLESIWETMKLGDVEAVMAFNHKGNLEWWSGKTYPYGNNALKRSYKVWFNYEKPVSFELKPIDIHVFGDVATVFYQSKWKGTGGSSESSRHLCAFIKEDNKWKQIGSMGCSCVKPPKCQ